MLKKWLPNWFNGLIVGCFLFLNEVFFGFLILLFGLIKLCVPHGFINILLHKVYRGWCIGNRFGLWLGCSNIHIDINGDLNSQGWYLLICNHLSWLDIAVLSSVNALPAPKFFLKDELKYVPFIGTSAWAMGMPFMKRVSKEQIAKNPKLSGLDIARTKQSCRNFRDYPTTIINFVEGTRYTADKHSKQQSPFKHLLRPKAGGIAFALEVLGEQFDAMLNTSLVYSGRTDHTCRNLLKGELDSIYVSVDVIPINEKMLGSYQTDEIFKMNFQQYVNDLWVAKDRQLTGIYTQPSAKDIRINEEIETL